jgi:NitT/TauT family transport system substrate-binding protein
LVLRALFKGADLCVSRPRDVAEQLLALGYVDSVDEATSALQEIQYNSWREYDPEDTLRFFALRMHESGVISSNPSEVVARIGDWKALKELKLELKT